ncbi:hypothetical protein GCM10007116_22310 [Sulfodiicoccus acidiphilus]|uniref:Uncharacterized protein n=1 Tax=Sulfodiicoccus acidiphilus TaxID=1670455 RepID=A0A830H5A3_9CREN|nr:hypothetical protein GCM10007116_22310 [Sulfodiicoccus acidiphilus]
MVVNAGSRINPQVPYLRVGETPGRDIRKRAFLKEEFEEIFGMAKQLGASLDFVGSLIVGESIPGGTTTAAATLVGLGYEAGDRTSSTSPHNPKELKRRVISQAIANAPKELLPRIAALTDPVLTAIAGLMAGFKGRKVLAGGTQMLAVVAILKALSFPIDEVEIITTKWVVEDPSADFLGLAKELGVKVSNSTLDLSDSKFPGLRAYEEGYVKEGVGAGGLSYMAISAFGHQRVIESIEREYIMLTKLNVS